MEAKKKINVPLFNLSVKKQVSELLTPKPGAKRVSGALYQTATGQKPVVVKTVNKNG